jgi:thioredoxin 1
MIKVSSTEFDLEIAKSNSPYLLKFGSKTCGPCNIMKPVLEKLTQENPDFKIFDIDTDESPELASHFEIRSVPTMHFCEGREIIYSTYGVTPYKDLQFVVDNINDPYLRLHGQFNVEQKKSHFTAILIICIVAFIALLVAL